MNDRHFTDFNVAGFTCCDAGNVFCDLKTETAPSLNIKPTNRFNACAATVYHILNEAAKIINQSLNLGFKEPINRIIQEYIPNSKRNSTNTENTRDGKNKFGLCSEKNDYLCVLKIRIFIWLSRV
jgi:hypothetical protein